MSSGCRSKVSHSDNCAPSFCRAIAISRSGIASRDRMCIELRRAVVFILQILFIGTLWPTALMRIRLHGQD